MRALELVGFLFFTEIFEALPAVGWSEVHEFRDRKCSGGGARR
jgi:hypothetical protein